MMMKIFIVSLLLLKPLYAEELYKDETITTIPQNTISKENLMSMKKNIGTSDRFIRLTISAIFFSLAWWCRSWILLGIAVFTLYEAVAGWCALYQLIGKNSCPIG
jgi:hypothetical protein